MTSADLGKPSELWLSIIVAALLCHIICTAAADLIWISAGLESSRTGKWTCAVILFPQRPLQTHVKGWAELGNPNTPPLTQHIPG